MATIAVALVMGGFSVFAQTWNIGGPVSLSGPVTSRVTATLSDGVLTINGTGEMASLAPTQWAWHSVRNSITSVNISNGVTNIGLNAFQNCRGLTSVTIPNSVTSIGGSAFEGCTGLTSITIPNTVTSIGGSAFENCTGLTSVTIPNSVTTLHARAFKNCMGLTTITIPNNVFEMYANVFEGCTGLTSAIIGNGVKEINGAFLNCTGLTSVNFGSGLTSTGGSDFKGCTSLTTITLPNNITSIGRGAFSGCTGLTSITIPSSVTSIGEYAFEGCTSLTTVICMRTTPPFATNAFGNVRTATLYVPSTSRIELYQNAAPWKNFSRISKNTADVPATTNQSTSLPTSTKTTSEQGVVINGVRWATSNVATGNMGEPKRFAANPEDAGMFYQWDKSYAYPATGVRYNGWSNYGSSSTIWEKATDPSPAGWRVPTSEEFDKLLDTNKVNSEWTTQNGVTGRKFTDKATGNSIFLPAVGQRFYRDGELNYEGTGGFYWSSTQKDDEQAFHLNLSKDGMYNNTRRKSSGLSVRSVASSASVTTSVRRTDLVDRAANVSWIVGDWLNGETDHEITFEADGTFSTGDDCSTNGTYTIQGNAVQLNGTTVCLDCEDCEETEYHKTMTIKENSLDGYKKID